jgi:hypothetical protein
MNNYSKVFRFENGYGANVVCHDRSWGGKEGFFEIAILDKHGEICYTTSISNDVMGWCTFEWVTKTLKEIKALPKDES